MFSALALAAIFAVLSTAGNYWMTLKVADLHSGLWSVCTRGKCFPSDGGGKNIHVFVYETALC